MSEQISIIKGELRPVLVSALFFMLLTGLAYPLFTTAVANVLFPYQAQGGLIRVDGEIIGAELIGQPFTTPGYFHPRPSAVAYDAMAGYGSNLGPTNPKLTEKVAERVQAYRATNGLPEDARVPVDAVTASASGLDPHISIANARLQAARVAKARDLPQERVLGLIAEYSTPRQLLLLGQPRVNVLKINLALDALQRQ
ncbi:MAG: potassium-transporting ATPase subunit KdpC [Nitrococcus sp.]|nr:potassium-transporting ATPase subunit KdpC [Nitrococcus sp.]